MTDMSWKPPIGGDRPSGDDSADRPHRELRIGGLIVAVFFIGMLGWASLTPLDAGAYAPGVIAVSGRRQAVQHRAGGIATAIHIVAGQTGNNGEPVLPISIGRAASRDRVEPLG